MWLLESDGDVLDGKKLWLKPGQRYLFGRNKADTAANEHSFALNHKTVSRKHVILSVAAVVAGEGTALNSRSAITITDESKIGTDLDGERFVKESRTLNKKEHIFHLGHAEEKFKITWRPVVLTFHFKKEKGGSTDEALLRVFQRRLEQFDIKTIEPYVSSETTHVVSMHKRRNIPKALRALVNGKYIVTEEFIDAVEAKATPTAGAVASPLEEDFDKYWPDAMDYLPPVGGEPVPRPVDMFKPDMTRNSMFEGFTFVLADETQFETLGPVVMDGGAKAIKFDMKPGETTVPEFVKFIFSTADRKGLRSLGDTSQAKGVVLVRFRWGKDGTPLNQQGIEFLQEVDAKLEQRSIEQNEFLDAILTGDVSKLRQPLQDEDEEMSGTRAPPSTAVQTSRPSRPNGVAGDMSAPSRDEPSQSAAQEAPPPSQAPRSAMSRLRSRRVVAQSRFKGFDDFDESQFASQRRKSQVHQIDDEDEDVPDAGQSRSPSQAPSAGRGVGAEDSQSLFIQDDEDATSQRNATQQSSSFNPRKRALPASEDEEDAIDSLFPAAAAMKRRRLEDEAQGKTSSFRDKPVDLNSQQKRKSKKEPAVKEVDVRTAARIRAEAIDAQRKQYETQRPDEDMDPDAIANLRNLVIIDEMPLRKPPVNNGNTNGTSGDNWDDRWNGRKNFKKFVKARPGQAADGVAVAPNRARKVIVTLEEVKRKTFGMSEEDYFLQPNPGQSNRGKRSGGASQSQAQPSQTTESQARRRGGAVGSQSIRHTGAADEDEVVDLDPEEIAGQPREGPVAAALRRIQGELEDEGQSQSQPVTSRKRAAPAAAKAAPPAKRRATPARMAGRDDDDSDEEEVKFRLRRPVRK